MNIGLGIGIPFSRSILYQALSTSLYLDFVSNETLDSRITFTRASGATRINPAGLIETVASNAPRFDYDPVTLQPKGLLIEEQRTNELLNSDEMATQSITVTAAQRTLSFYGAGTVTLSGAYSGALVGSGVYPARSTLTFTPTAGILTLTVTGSARFSQMELGAFPTSYIPTTNAAATRAAEVAVMTGVNFYSWYRQDEGTLFAEFQRLSINFSSTLFPRVFSVGKAGSSNELIELLYSSPNDQFALVSGGVAQGPVILANGGVAVNKIAGAYKLNDVAASINSSPAVTDNASLIPTVSQMNIGNRQDGARPYSGHIRRIAYFPRRLSNAELQGITA